MARKNLNWGNIKFNWVKSSAKIITNKGFTPELNRYFAKTLAKYAYDYVPYSFPEDNDYEGKPIHLADLTQIRVYKDYALLVYEKAYANVQYNGYFNHLNQQHPKATRQWVDAAWRDNKPRIQRKVRIERRRLSKK